jgi:hypothetical protein
MKSSYVLALALLCSACAHTHGPMSGAGLSAQATGANSSTQQTMSSPECVARNLKPGEPFPVAAIPEAVLKKAQSGSVALRYDVVAGAAQNVVVVASSPPGVYDAAALQHAARYREPTGTTVRGCVMTIDIKF